MRDEDLSRGTPSTRSVRTTARRSSCTPNTEPAFATVDSWTDSSRRVKRSGSCPLTSTSKNARITNWRRESRSPTLAYRNTETGVQAVLHRAPDSYRYKWRGAILVDGYPVWSRGTRRKTRRRSVTSSGSVPPGPQLSGVSERGRSCRRESGRRGECPAVVRLPRLWVRSPSRIVYGAER